MFGVQKVNKITCLLASLEKDTEYGQHDGQIPWNKVKTVSKILKIMFGETNNSEGISSYYESNFLNYIEI